MTPQWRHAVDRDALAHLASRLGELRRTGGRVVIAGHVGPDGDTLGSALALHLGLTALGIDSWPTVGDDPLRVPAALADLPGVAHLSPVGDLPDASTIDLLITVDVASQDRLGLVSDLVGAGVETIVIDHHASATDFGDHRIVAPAAAATVQLVEVVLGELGVPLDTDIATCLYVGLVTDTGRFGHDSTDRSAMEMGGRLIEAGVDHAGWHRRLFATSSLAELELVGIALGRMGFIADVALVHSHVTTSELERSGLGVEAVESLVDLLRTVDVADVALVLKPLRAGVWSASLRARAGIDVGQLAARFGGGGHRAAAGFTVAEEDPQGVVDAIAAALRERRR